MRPVILIAAALAAALSGTSAYAQSAAVVDESRFDWTGFYAGAHLGGGWGDQSWTNLVSTFAPSNGLNPGNGTYDGIFGGVQAGYNRQIGQVVIGVEGDWSASGIDGSFTCFGLDFSATCSSDINWTATLATRLGYAFDHVLIFVKGGLAIADIDVGAVTINGDTYSGGETQVGAMFGAGVEYAALEHWSATLQYDYLAFNDRIGFAPGVVASFLGGFNWSSEIDSDVHRMRLGVNYRW